MGKLNLVLDLDNTIISSVSQAEMKKIKKIEERKLQYEDMEQYYRVFYRPHLEEFLDFAFKNFNVTVWTAASKEYAAFIIDKIIINGKKGRKLKMFFYDVHCEQSRDMYGGDSPKNLKYLYHFKGYFPCNTIIMDDHPAVFSTNTRQVIKADYFDASLLKSEKDNFLLRTIRNLTLIKKKFDEEGCKRHCEDIDVVN